MRSPALLPFTTLQLHCMKYRLPHWPLYLSLAPAATRAVLPVYVVSYPVLPVYVVSYPVLPVYVVSYAMLPVYVVSYPVLPLVRCASQDWTGVATQSNLVLQTQNILNASGV